MQLHWHRRNLRPHPNPALSAAIDAAAESGDRVVSTFVLDDGILRHADGLRVAFMLGALYTLRDWYRSHGSDLLIRHGDAAEVVVDVAGTVGADRVVWNGDHSRLARGRDGAVVHALDRAGIDHAAVSNGQPGGTGTSTGPIAKREDRRTDSDGRLADPDALGLDPGTLPRLSELVGDAVDPTPLTVGTDTTEKRLRAMADGRTYRRCDDVDTSVGVRLR